MPKASSLAAEIKSGLSVEPDLIVGKGGCFEVIADGKVVFSKNQAGRFPEVAEVISVLRDLDAS